MNHLKYSIKSREGNKGVKDQIKETKNKATNRK